MKQCRTPSRTDFMKRRGFLKNGAAAAAPLMIPAWAHAGPESGGRLKLGVIGIGARGKYLIGNLPETVTVTALCDCSIEHVETARQPTGIFASILAKFASGDAKDCRVYRDYRQMLAEQSFDAVVIATPDHHHALAAILAIRGGADVYIEKPLAVTIAEGRAIADAADRFGRVVQVGSQQRTMQVNRTACEFLRDGGLGKIHLVEAQNYPGPMHYQADDYPAEPIPESLSWDLFCGPTPMRPYNKNLWVKDEFKHGYLTWRGWDLFRQYSGHLMTNWGAHSIDMVQFALGKDDTGPERISLDEEAIDSSIDDAWHHKTPPLGTLKDRRIDRMRFCPVKMWYADGTLLHFKPGVKKTIFHGAKGTLSLSRNSYRTEPSGLLMPPDPNEQAKWSGAGHVAKPHLEDWIRAIHDRGSTNAPIEVGHRSVTVCHLANIARELGTSLKWDPAGERFFDSDDANGLLGRPRRNGFALPS